MYRLLSDGVPPELLTLEVTESVAVDEHAAGILTELRNAGVRVALDDFGTGYSALSAVSRLPIDVIKIDRSIVQRIRERDGRAVVAAVLAIAESLELQTVAEGIERLADEWFLAELGCPSGRATSITAPCPRPRHGNCSPTPPPSHDIRDPSVKPLICACDTTRQAFTMGWFSPASRR